MKYFNELKNTRGFTLVEMMFVVFLSAMVGYVIFASARSGNQHMDIQETKMTLSDAGWKALHRMTQEIRQSAPEKITIAEDAQSIEFEVPDPEDLILEEEEDADDNYTVNWNSAHTIRYALGGTDDRQIIRTDTTTNETTVIGNHITSMEFAGDEEEPSLVTVTLGLQRQDATGRNIPATPLRVSAQAEVRNPNS